MLTIRLQRRGRKNDPAFRVIVVDSKKAPKTGAYLEMLGSLDRRTDRTELNAERIRYWISQGAKTSDTVHNLLVSQKIIEGKKVNVLPKRSPLKAEEPKAEESKTAEPKAPEQIGEPVVNEVAAETKTE